MFTTGGELVWVGVGWGLCRRGLTIKWPVRGGNPNCVSTVLGEVRGHICADGLEYTSGRDACYSSDIIGFFHEYLEDICHKCWAVFNHESPVCLPIYLLDIIYIFIFR